MGMAKRNKHNHMSNLEGQRNSRGRKSKAAAPSAPVVDTSPRRQSRIAWSIAALAILGALSWSYLPTLIRLVTTWENEPDYSHGFLVLPLALWFLWVRREQFPGFQGPGWGGVTLLIASMLMRWAAAAYYVDAVEDWSLVVWCAGLIWLLLGKAALLWSWPAVLFLLFMIPMPYRAERLLSVPLQEFAAQASVWILQLLGQEALAEGTVIWTSGHQLEVEEACSGLRLFMGVIALAYAYIVVVRTAWWETLLLVLSILPIALLANALRIVITALLYHVASSKAAEAFNHDFAGWLMIPLAMSLFGAMLFYLKTVFPLVRVMDVREIVRQDYV